MSTRPLVASCMIAGMRPVAGSNVISSIFIA